MSPTRTATQRLADHLLGGPVEAWIRERQDEGKSLRAIARELWSATDHHIDVTGETLRRWLLTEAEDGSPPKAKAS